MSWRRFWTVLALLVVALGVWMWAGIRLAEAATIKVTLTWIDNSADEDGFLILRKVDSGLAGPLASVAAGVTTYIDGPLTPGSKYCYQVSATKGFLTSPPTTEACVTAPLPPAAPSGLNLTVTVGP